MNWENANHACLDKNNLQLPPLSAEVARDLQQWSEDEAIIKRKPTEELPEPQPTNSTPTETN